MRLWSKQAISGCSSWLPVSSATQIFLFLAKLLLSISVELLFWLSFRNFPSDVSFPPSQPTTGPAIPTFPNNISWGESGPQTDSFFCGGKPTLARHQRRLDFPEEGDCAYANFQGHASGCQETRPKAKWQNNWVESVINVYPISCWYVWLLKSPWDVRFASLRVLESISDCAAWNLTVPYSGHIQVLSWQHTWLKRM